MQASKMAAIRLLRTQSSFLNPSKFNLLYPSLNSLYLCNHHNRNPNVSRHFHLSRFFFPKSSLKSPLDKVDGGASVSSPRDTVQSAFGSPEIEPTNSINSGVSDSKEAEAKLEEVVSRVNFQSNVANNFVSRGRGKKGKSKVSGVCSDCGKSESHNNNNVGISESLTKRSWLPAQMVGQDAPVRLADVNISHLEWRIQLSGLLGMEVNMEVNIVDLYVFTHCVSYGHGKLMGVNFYTDFSGSLILVSGDPGVGKSTLALQMAALIAESCDVGGAAPVLYVSGEESVEQIGNRANRLSINTEELLLYSGTDVEDIVEKGQALSPRALVVDSIQTVHLEAVTGLPGGLMRVKECTSEFLRFAKKTNIPVILIGHVNKSGEIAGPSALQHIVDVVLFMQGEKDSPVRLLRSVKNRFGSTDELGVFQMSNSGLEALLNTSEMFLREEHAESAYLAGIAMTVIIAGSRPSLTEVQALCVSGTSPGGIQNFNGVNYCRADMIVTILKKQAGVKLKDQSISLNVINGIILKETSGDLAIAVAICSSFLKFPLPNNVAFIGEIDLNGELRMIPRIDKGVQFLARLGYKKCVVPESAMTALAAVSTEIQIVGCKNLIQVIRKVFRKQD